MPRHSRRNRLRHTLVKRNSRRSRIQLVNSGASLQPYPLRHEGAPLLSGIYIVDGIENAAAQPLVKGGDGRPLSAVIDGYSGLSPLKTSINIPVLT